MPTRFFIVVSWGPRLSVLTCLPQGTREVIVSQQMIRRFWIQMPLQQNGFALSITLNTAKVIKGHNLEKICKTFNKNLPELKSLMLVKLQLGNFLKAVASLIGYLIPNNCDQWFLLFFISLFSLITPIICCHVNESHALLELLLF